MGLAALQSGDDVRAQEKLQLATRLAPGEPASWADLGLLSARQQDFEAAYTNVEHARSLAPDDSGIEALLGVIEDRRGKLPEAIAHLQKAVQLDAKNAKAQFSLAEETEREGKPSSDADAEKLFAKLLGEHPDNVAVLLEVARLAAKTGDGATLQNAVGKLSQASASWPPEVKEQMNALRGAAGGSNPHAAAVRVMYLRNTLARVPDYRKSLNEVKTPTTFVSDPFVRFLKLPQPNSQSAPADLSLKFETKPIEGAPAEPVSWVGAIPLDDQGGSSILWASQGSVQIAGGAKLSCPRREWRSRHRPELRLQDRPGLRRRGLAGFLRTAGPESFHRHHGAYASFGEYPARIVYRGMGVRCRSRRRSGYRAGIERRRAHGAAE